MTQKGEMRVVNDLDHPEITGVRDGVLPGDRHPGYQLPGAIHPKGGPAGIRLSAGIEEQDGGEEKESWDGVEFHMLKSMNIQFCGNIVKRT
jgi:hypothetical protein